jgi:hypothetical protein
MLQRMGSHALVAIVLGLGACAKPQPVVDVNGECADAYQARVCTWARMQGQQVVEAGVMLPVAAIENAPMGEGQMVWPPVPTAVLALPESAHQQSGFTQFTMFWDPMGHPPATYMTPHFDFHFYSIPAGEVSSIDCLDTAKPAALPAGYALPDEPLPPPMVQLTGVSTLVGICVPRMGMHSLSTAESESKATFRGSMVIGYYHGKPIFIEPMLSRALLLEKRSFDLAVPSIPGMEGNYPRRFHAEYDPQANTYRFAFSDFRAGA